MRDSLWRYSLFIPVGVKHGGDNLCRLMTILISPCFTLAAISDSRIFFVKVMVIESNWRVKPWDFVKVILIESNGRVKPWDSVKVIVI